MKYKRSREKVVYDIQTIISDTSMGQFDKFVLIKDMLLAKAECKEIEKLEPERGVVTEFGTEITMTSDRAKINELVNEVNKIKKVLKGDK